YALAAIGIVLYGIGVHIQLELARKGFLRVPEARWRRWLGKPAERRGPIGALIADVAGAVSLADASARFARLRAVETAPFERDLKVMRTCVGAAPLFGLLGTVTGMLTTFDALASGSGGEKTMAMIASGISEALITTETGLVLALPGLFFQYQLARKHERYKAFLAHLENVVTQALHRRLSTGAAA
ncbi:MAG TPA: MotA/TolQ/ExbB proton channel family protein, partial [Planctomycetota bacterium]|nr:MotA/TolQ/ExbB proton channel family protein [Planctomycetota bacterium]